MSYSFTIAADAQADLRKLDLWLQEQFLDEIELLVDDRFVLPDSGNEIVYAFRRDAGDQAYFVNVTLVCNDLTKQ